MDNDAVEYKSNCTFTHPCPVCNPVCPFCGRPWVARPYIWPSYEPVYPQPYPWYGQGTVTWGTS